MCAATCCAPAARWFRSKRPATAPSLVEPKTPCGVPIKTSDRDWQYQEVHISTSIDIREGQKVVVGKANIDNADNALILVLTAKVIE